MIPGGGGADTEIFCAQGMTATVAGIEASSGLSPTIVGKPSQWLIRRILAHYGFDPSR